MHNGLLRTSLSWPRDKIPFPLDCRLCGKMLWTVTDVSGFAAGQNTLPLDCCLSRKKKYSFPDDFAPSSGWQGCWQAGTDARTEAYLVGSISPEDVPTSPSWTDSAQLAAGLELRWAKGAKPKA